MSDQTPPEPAESKPAEYLKPEEQPPPRQYTKKEALEILDSRTQDVDASLANWPAIEKAMSDGRIDKR